MTVRAPLVIDARGLGLAHAGRGIGRVIVELLEGLARIGAVADVAGPDVVRPHLGPTLRWVPKPARHWNWILTHGRLEGARVLRLAPTVPGPLDERTTACCYDFMPLKAPLEHYPLRTRLRHPIAWPAMNHAYDIFARARHVWAISRATAADAVHLLGVDPARIRPVPLAAPSWSRPATTAEIAAARRHIGIDGRFILWVLSGLNANKNHVGMLRAVAAVPTLPPVVVVGSFARYSAQRARFDADAGGVGTRVQLVGRVADEVLRGLLSAATCVAVPSLDEGFALPIAEALAGGTTVVANDIPVLRELAQPGVVYADAASPEAFGAALASECGGRRRTVAAPKRSWDDVAREVYALALE